MKTALAWQTAAGLEALTELGFESGGRRYADAVVGAPAWWVDRPDDEVPEFVAMIGQLLPRFFILEIPRGITSPRHSDYFEARLDELETIGYVVDWRILDAIDYGGGAERKRLFILGQRIDVVEERKAKHAIHWPRRQRRVYHAYATGKSPMVPLYKALIAPNINPGGTR